MKTMFLFKTICRFVVAISFFIVSVSCGSEEPMEPKVPQVPGKVSGTVKDELGFPYPTKVNIFKGNRIEDQMVTDSLGNFELNAKDVGTYQFTISPPLYTKVVTQVPATVNIQANQATTLDFVLQVQPVEAHLNLGKVDVLHEIRDKDGNVPTDPDEPLYTANYYEEPIGLLSAITAPDGHHVTLSEWKTAKGTLTVHCNGTVSIVEIALEGMIPKGVYAVFLAFLNKTKSVGESLTNGVEFVYPANPPLGSPSANGNRLVAGSDGTITATIEHPSCILTEEVALVIPILYLINGSPDGSGGSGADKDNTAHLLVYFQ